MEVDGFRFDFPEFNLGGFLDSMSFMLIFQGVPGVTPCFFCPESEVPIQRHCVSDWSRTDKNDPPCPDEMCVAGMRTEHFSQKNRKTGYI